MIYENTAADAPIRQGDIFMAVPKISFSLERMSILTEAQEAEETSWEDIRGRDQVAAVVGVRPVTGIVITQDCDTVRTPDLALCELKPLFDVLRGVTPPKTDKAWGDLIRTQAIKNLKWFYLPVDPRFGFQERQAVDFQSVIRVPREELERARHLRVGRLNAVADEHFRERLAEFFRRYPYNEWYPFTKEEFAAYRAGHPEESSAIEPYEHQK